MNRMIRPTSLLLAMLFLVTVASPAIAAPIITHVESQVVILENSRLQVRYRLTFVDDDSRSQITTMGPFDPGHSQIEAHLDHEGAETPVTMVPLGDDKYRAEFQIETQPGGTYTVEVRYLVNSYLDPTMIDGTPYRVLTWAPPQWALPIDEQIVTIIFPIELPPDLTEPEQITDEIVNDARILVSQDVVMAFDRWIYYPTPDADSGKTWLSLYLSSEGLQPNEHFLVSDVYVPADYFASIPTPEPTPFAPLASEQPTELTPTPPSDERRSPIALLLGLAAAGGLLLAGGIVYGTMRLVAPKPVPVGYESPEIEIETFQQPLRLYAGNTVWVVEEFYDNNRCIDL